MTSNNILFPLDKVNLGIGTDIECIDRFRKEFKGRHDSSLRRIFTSDELEYCFSYRDYAPHLAATYCAKEAVVKALACIGIKNLNYRKIEIYNDANNVPQVRIEIQDAMHIRPLLSLSHCEDKALAFVIVMAYNEHTCKS